MAPPTAVPAPATVVSTAFQKGSRRPIVVAVRVLVFLRAKGWRDARERYVGCSFQDLIVLLECRGREREDVEMQSS